MVQISRLSTGMFHSFQGKNVCVYVCVCEGKCESMCVCHHCRDSLEEDLKEAQALGGAPLPPHGATHLDSCRALEVLEP